MQDFWDAKRCGNFTSAFRQGVTRFLVDAPAVVPSWGRRSKIRGGRGGLVVSVLGIPSGSRWPLALRVGAASAAPGSLLLELSGSPVSDGSTDPRSKSR